MRATSNAACAAIALSCLSLAAPAVAGDARQIVQVRVSRDGLNMTDAGHRARFHARVDRAARSACGVWSGSIINRNDASRCVAEMHDDADRQVAMLIVRSPVRLAQR